ncbi:serine hydrolase domain-containing protein [Streptomyces sp. NPDC004726]
MTELRDVLTSHTSKGTVPGAVGLVARGDRIEVRTAGSVDIDRSAPMARDSIFRIASLTKPIVAAAVMTLVDDGRLGLYDPVAEWLPELTSPMVVRTPRSPVDDVVPAARPITVFDLLTARAGYGYPADFTLPAVQSLFTELRQTPPLPDNVPPPDEWTAALSRIPLLHQPGDAWLYNTTSDIQGVLAARASGRTLPELLAERLFEPLGMSDTGFGVPPAKLGRLTSLYRPDEFGGLVLWDAPDGQWSHVPKFPSGGGGLVSTADDLHSFARMLLADGTADGRRVLTPESVRLMTTDHLTPSQRAASHTFLHGQGWGFGGSVDVEPIDPWNIPGRYGWVGGTGTAAHVVPSTGTVTILLTQVALTGPTSPQLMRDFWRCTADA